MSVTITFLGGADTVTGSKYLVTPRQAPPAGRLRPVPGRQAAAPAQPDTAAGGTRPDRRGGADPCPPGPQRLPAAAGQGRVQPARSMRHRAPATCARSCCPTAATCRKKTRHSPTAMASPSTRPHCRCTPATTPVPASSRSRPAHSASASAPSRAGTSRFQEAGHILGAASVLLEVAGRRILFSGDLGRRDDLIMNPPANAPLADTVLIESTYGDREHPTDDLLSRTRAAAAQGGGTRRRGRGPGVRGRARAGPAARDRAAQGAQGDSAIAAGVPGQPDGGAHDPSVRTAPGRASPERTGVARPDPQRHHGQQHRRVQGAGQAPRPDGDSVGQRHGHRWTGAAPPGALPRRPPQHGDPDRIPGARHPRRIAGRWRPHACASTAAISTSTPRSRSCRLRRPTPTPAS